MRPKRPSWPLTAVYTSHNAYQCYCSNPILPVVQSDPIRRKMAEIVKSVSGLLPRRSHELLSHFPQTRSDRLIVGAAGRWFLLTLHKVFASHLIHLGRSRQVERGLSTLLCCEQERLEQLYRPGGRTDHPVGKIRGRDPRMQRVHADPGSLKSARQFI